MRIFPGFVCVALAMVVGCGSSSSSSSGSSGDPPADGGTDTGPPPTGTMTVAVVAPPLDNSFPDPLPTLPGANIAVDLPGGEHRDLVAGPDGRLTVDKIDWSKGTASVLGYAATKQIYAVTDVGPDSFAKIPKGTIGADVVLFMFPQPKTLYSVVLKVTIANADPASNDFLVAATSGSQIIETKGKAFDMTVRPNAPLKILVRQGVLTVNQAARSITVTGTKWVSFDLPAPTAGPLQLDLAAGTAITPTILSGKTEIAGGDSGPLGGKSMGAAFAPANEAQFNLGLGYFTSMAPSADKNAFEWNLEVVSAFGLTAGLNAGINLPDGRFTQVSRDTLPSAGETITGLGVPPTTPTATTTSLATPVPIEGLDPTAVVRLGVNDSAGTFSYLIDAPPGTKTMHVPALPAGARPAGNLTVTGQIFSLANNDEKRGFYRKFSGTATFDVKF